jgi:hypothetical protein
MNIATPSRMGLHDALPPFRVSNFAWKISLHFSNGSLSVKVANYLRAARSAYGLLDKNLTLPSQKYFAEIVILSIANKIMIKTENPNAHCSSSVVSIEDEPMSFPHRSKIAMNR